MRSFFLRELDLDWLVGGASCEVIVTRSNLVFSFQASFSWILVSTCVYRIQRKFIDMSRIVAWTWLDWCTVMLRTCGCPSDGSTVKLQKRSQCGSRLSILGENGSSPVAQCTKNFPFDGLPLLLLFIQLYSWRQWELIKAIIRCFRKFMAINQVAKIFVFL